MPSLRTNTKQNAGEEANGVQAMLSLSTVNDNHAVRSDNIKNQ